MVFDLFGSAVKLQRTKPAAPTGNFRRRNGHDAEDFRKLQTESGAAKRSPTETQKLGSRLGTDFQGASRLRRERLRPGGMQGRTHP
jgi:hypothetical protein